MSWAGRSFVVGCCEVVEGMGLGCLVAGFEAGESKSTRGSGGGMNGRERTRVQDSRYPFVSSQFWKSFVLLRSQKMKHFEFRVVSCAVMLVIHRSSAGWSLCVSSVGTFKPIT